MTELTINILCSIQRKKKQWPAYGNQSDNRAKQHG